MVILVSGLPGSGKSFFAEKLAARLDAYYLSSDRIRKEVFKHPTYTEEEKKAVYSEMKRRLIALLKTDSSKNIILDATFFKEDLRKTFCRESITYKTTCKTFIITANDEDIQERVKQKRAYSDADYSVHLKLKEQFEWPQSDYLVLDSSCLHINQMLDQAVAYLKTSDSSMEKDQLNKLIFPDTSKPLSQVETSISWVLFSEKRVYKIKRPVKTSFLDFTSLESRKYYCEKELILNQRFSSDLYLSVQPVRQSGGNYTIGEGSGPIVDYALEMKKLPTGKELNNLLLKNKVTETDIHSIAEVIATFHRSVPPLIIHNQSDLIKDKTSDILNYSDIFYTIDPAFKTFIEQSTNDCLLFIQKNAPLLESRMQQGYIRDGHGDLHSGNIFLLDKPVLFDCIEFSDALRQIDVMEELAFLSMDFDCFGRKDFGTLILDSYNSANPAIITPEEHLLFLFYKYYKAGVRAKVMAVQWSRELDKNSRLMLEQQMQTYILLMQDYFKQLQEGFS